MDAGRRASEFNVSLVGFRTLRKPHARAYRVARHPGGVVYKIDYRDGDVLCWSLAADGGVTCERVTEYTPTIYCSTAGALDELRSFVDRLPAVCRTAVVERRTGWRHDPEPVLRIDVADLDGVSAVASDLRRWGSPGEYRCYNVDFSREFRYCLETGTPPVPARPLTTCELDVPEPEFAREAGIRELSVDGEAIAGDPPDVATAVADRVRAADPDVLILSDAAVVPALFAAAPVSEARYALGRRPGYQTLAGRSTYESYGRITHSPARYNLPGRAIVDESNTFIYHQGGLAGLLDLLERSWKPIQEAAWASIGNFLTAIQIRAARRRGVLTPWHSWRHEFFKTATQLDTADRGGFIFAPDVGLHADVHELDFASLYPNIIVTRNVSPETIRCGCHRDRADVPGLDYAICDADGYLTDVLAPLVDDREAYKAELRETDDPDRRATLSGRVEALKWILVSCFGYQGFSNAKFGRIECHEAINAFAREILLDTKETLEANGWRVVHGIVDSIWVTPIDGAARTPLPALADRISRDVGIRLEYEGAFDWVAFVPLRTKDSGALTKYFGARADPGPDEDRFKYRGIEVRQRSTPPYVAAVQRELIATLDRHREPAPVCDVLQRRLGELRRGAVDPQTLVVDNRVSKALEAYTQFTRNVAALERATAQGLGKHPGQSVAYVVVDDDSDGRDRVALAHEEPDTYDADFYADLLVRATESVVSPIGWREGDVRSYLADRTDASLAGFG